MHSRNDEPAQDDRPRPEDGPFTPTIDGAVVPVTVRPGADRSYTWETGPNVGYGFSSTTFVAGDSTAEPPLLTVEQHRDAIREFLGSINPETGYLD